MSLPEKARNERGVEQRETLRSTLKSAGFHQVGFASSKETPGADRFREWIGRGYHGEMDYLAKNLERRCHPD